MWFDIFFCLFSFLISSFNIRFFLRKLTLWFSLIFFIGLSHALWPMTWVWRVNPNWLIPYYPGYMSIMLNSGWLTSGFLFLFLSNFIISYLIYWKFTFGFWKNIFSPCYWNIFFWLILVRLLYLYFFDHSIKIKLVYLTGHDYNPNH